jgi:membrane fusion protein, copper/silver efflux system
MTKRSMITGIVAVAVLAAVGAGAWWIGMSQGMRMTAGASATPEPGRKVLYWQDPMVPGQKFDKPGKSPFMDMQLVPVYADEGGGEAPAVRVDPGLQQNLGIRTAEVTRGRIENALQAVGNVAYNERDVALVQARSNGYLERLHVRAPLDAVRRGQPLAELYVPDWIAAQEEYLSVQRMGSAAPAGLLEAAAQRMRLAGMSDAQVSLVERGGKAQARMTIAAPIAGVISELTAREGMTVMNGAPLFRINGLATVWVNAEVPESMAPAVRPGAAVQVSTAAFPNEHFAGKVTAILPQVDAATRTLKARIEVENPKAKLVPGMFATVAFAASGAADVLLVPSEAVIRTGKRNLVMLAGEQGRFVPVEVELGQEGGGRVEVRKGLEAGQKVVVSGQFLVDSEASLKGIEIRMPKAAPTAAPASGAAPQVHQGHGRIEGIAKDEIMLSHEPIASLQWPAMTMGFKPPPGGVPPGLKAGDMVEFEMQKLPDGGFGLTAMRPMAGARK